MHVVVKGRKGIMALVLGSAAGPVSPTSLQPFASSDLECTGDKDDILGQNLLPLPAQHTNRTIAHDSS